MAAEAIARQTTVVDDKTVDVAMSLSDYVEDRVNRTDTRAWVVQGGRKASSATPRDT